MALMSAVSTHGTNPEYTLESLRLTGHLSVTGMTSGTLSRSPRWSWKVNRSQVTGLPLFLGCAWYGWFGVELCWMRRIMLCEDGLFVGAVLGGFGVVDWCEIVE